MSQYLKLIKADTPYAKKMTYLRNRIFGDMLRPSDQKSKRIVRLFEKTPIFKTDFYVNYYPRHVEAFNLISKLRKYGLFRDDHIDFQEEMKKARILRGKVKPRSEVVKQAVNKL